MITQNSLSHLKKSFFAEPIESKHLSKLSSSWREDNPVPLNQLRYVKVLHVGFDQKVHSGAMIVHEKVAEEVCEIFYKLFENQYPIEKMKLIDHYGADDELSCADNNTAAFCSRPITGSNNQWSYHSYGLAIDLNPLYNPYQKGTTVVPKNGAPFLDRDLDLKVVLKPDDECVKLFKSYGWKWGGDWLTERGYVDYQHFYKELEAN